MQEIINMSPYFEKKRIIQGICCLGVQDCSYGNKPIKATIS